MSATSEVGDLHDGAFSRVGIQMAFVGGRDPSVHGEMGKSLAIEGGGEVRWMVNRSVGRVPLDSECNGWEDSATVLVPCLGGTSVRLCAGQWSPAFGPTAADLDVRLGDGGTWWVPGGLRAEALLEVAGIRRGPVGVGRRSESIAALQQLAMEDVEGIVRGLPAAEYCGCVVTGRMAGGLRFGEEAGLEALARVELGVCDQGRVGDIVSWLAGRGVRETATGGLRGIAGEPTGLAVSRLAVERIGVMVAVPQSEGCETAMARVGLESVGPGLKEGW
jgi:hypothetical protein